MADNRRQCKPRDPDSECYGNSALTNELKVHDTKMDGMQSAMEQENSKTGSVWATGETDLRQPSCFEKGVGKNESESGD